MVIVPKVIRAQLDSNGSISVNLPSTNDPDLSVTGWTYTVTEHIRDGRDPFEIEVPYTETEIDLATYPTAVSAPVTGVLSELFVTDIGVTIASQGAVVAAQQSADDAAAAAAAAQTTADAATTTANAAATELASIEGGTWTPTAAAVANVSSVTPFAGQYLRVGNIVTCSVRVDITCTAATVVTTASLTLPIASDFTLSANCVGAGSANNAAVTIINPVVVNCDTATDKVTVSFLSLGAGIGAVCWVNFTYTVA